MSFPTILLLALGLAMDATAAAIARGVAAPAAPGRPAALAAARVAILFGGFQALMPMLGWLLGAGVGPQVEAWDHWIAFVLLTAIGGKMIWEAGRPPAPADSPGAAARDGRRGELRVLLLLAVATSLDAFAVGVTLPLVGAPLGRSVATIGVVTALASGLGFLVGRRFGTILGRRLDAAGGVVLIGIGLRLLVQHLDR
jgi:putative Mn2+ efflux pump MntP